MRYTVTKQRIDVLGCIWMPYGALCAISRDLSGYDFENIGDLKDRDQVERWVLLHNGDFSSIVDFRADFDVDGEHIVHEWARGEDSKNDWSDCHTEPD